MSTFRHATIEHATHPVTDPVLCFSLAYADALRLKAPALEAMFVHRRRVPFRKKGDDGHVRSVGDLYRALFIEMEHFTAHLEPVLDRFDDELPHFDALFGDIKQIAPDPVHAALLGYIAGYSEVVAHLSIARASRPDLVSVTHAAQQSLNARFSDLRPRLMQLLDGYLSATPRLAAHGRPYETQIHVDLNDLARAPELHLHYYRAGAAA